MIHYDIESLRCDNTGYVTDSNNYYWDEVQSSSHALMTIDHGDILPEHEGFPQRKVVKITIKKY